MVTVFPRTATPEGRIWDHAALGRVADRIRIMGYNLHRSGGDPGPLADTRWYDDIQTRVTAHTAQARRDRDRAVGTRLRGPGDLAGTRRPAAVTRESG
ncbi:MULTISPECIES: hypothetical protein [unclassified Streptomyces]|uniref:hypothetical protein n=1 Tax=unclassified Streptomyces TaxID=2593676 RepID=UPI002E0EC492|nr:hypothetical protein OG279_02445 [Streptomyces sp. NBC_01201]